MEEIRFSRNEVEELAGRLAGQHLSQEDAQLLLAIFSAASSHVIAYPIAGQGPGDLQEQLVNAFIPGDCTEFAIFARIGPAPISPIVPPRVGPTPPPVMPPPPDEPDSS
jgi:hypothetical protein